MKILKRNQLIILVISLMLITAGYLNFTANRENIITSTIADRSDTKIGDAELVSTIPKEEENNDKILNEKTNTIDTTNQINVGINDIGDSQSEQNEILEKTNASEIATAASTEDYYFTTSKLERNNMYSESLETYQEMYNNNNSTR
ncbi:MAG: SpoIIIAH-like family protein [Clostridia bacterium]|nr:SpoIIIAH-like family protein [Clostridia bacterium]